VLKKGERVGFESFLIHCLMRFILS